MKEDKCRRSEAGKENMTESLPLPGVVIRGEMDWLVVGGPVCCPITV